MPARPAYNLNELLLAYQTLPLSAFVGSPTFAAVRGCSVSKIEKERIEGKTPIPFRREGTRALYRKADIERWLNDPSIYEGTALHSTAEPDHSREAA